MRNPILTFILFSLSHIAQSGTLKSLNIDEELCTERNYLDISNHVRDRQFHLCLEYFEKDKANYVAAIEKFVSSQPSTDDLNLSFYKRGSVTNTFLAKPTQFTHIGFHIENNRMDNLLLMEELMNLFWSKKQKRSYVNHRVPLGFTVVMYPIVYNRIDRDNAEIASLLCRLGADFNEHSTRAVEGLPAPSPLPVGLSPLAVALTSDSLKIAKVMLECGADASFVEPRTRDSLLHLAAFRGNYEIYKLLVEKGAARNSVNRLGRTVLRMAYLGKTRGVGAKQHDLIIQDLKDNGVDRNIIGKKGELIGDTASRYGNEIRDVSVESLKDKRVARKAIFAEFEINKEVRQKTLYEAIYQARKKCKDNGFEICLHKNPDGSYVGFSAEVDNITKTDRESGRVIFMKRYTVKILVKGLHKDDLPR